MKTPFKNHIIDYNSAICHHKMLPKVLPCKTKPGGGVFFVVQFFLGTQIHIHVQICTGGLHFFWVHKFIKLPTHTFLELSMGYYDFLES